MASGTTFTDSGTGLQLNAVTDQFIGTSGTGIIVNNATDGLQTTTGTAILLGRAVNTTIDGVDVSSSSPLRTASASVA